MRICLLGLDNLALLAPEFQSHTVAGEGVQQTLLGRALARRGNDVSMVTWDHGQPNGREWDGIRVFKACAPARLEGAVRDLLQDKADWQAASARCRAYMAREHGEDQVLARYLEAFGAALRRSGAAVYGTAGA
jgi:hypothetical protein